LTARQQDANVGYGGGIAHLPDRGDGHLAILGVDCVHNRVARERDIARQTKHCPAMFSGPHFVGRSIVLPQSDIYGSGGKAHSLLAFLERDFGLPALATLNQQRRDE
jgi:hypothetical protein